MRPYIGGQAVIEGVMMRSPRSFVVTVRRPDGTIAIREQAWETLFSGLPFLRWPFFRGAVVLAESLHNGYSALNFSAEHGLPAEEGGRVPRPPPASAVLAFLAQAVMAAGDGEPGEPGQRPSAEAPSSSSGSGWMMALATLIAVVFFVALPHLLTWLVGLVAGPSFNTSGPAFHLVDGLFRVGILVGYLWLLSRTDDARRLFELHGAEHKAIWTYESRQALTVDNARPFTTRHPRCGTSFLFIVVGVSVALHVALLPWVPRLATSELLNQALLVLVKIPLAFPVAGIAYELQRLSARDNCPRVITWMTRPGVWLQSITTRQPVDAQLEVALLSLDRALAREEGNPRGPEGVTIYPSFAHAAGSPAR